MRCVPNHLAALWTCIALESSDASPTWWPLSRRPPFLWCLACLGLVLCLPPCLPTRPPFHYYYYYRYHLLTSLPIYLSVYLSLFLIFIDPSSALTPDSFCHNIGAHFSLYLPLSFSLSLSLSLSLILT
ncbi:hypothetical protein GQ44DRAFT_355774 [Phaeosphaeriaceae sp. PMI808]|nr:hypothetical protein GQ44DRAFT_355774 [Phaeosphaeriaceae sp. PMI808]